MMITLSDFRLDAERSQDVAPFIKEFLEESKDWPAEACVFVTNTSVAMYSDVLGRMVDMQGRSIAGTDVLITRWRSTAV